MASISDSLTQLKLDTSKRLVFGLLLFCAVGLPISLYRWFDIGFQPFFLAHIALSVSTFIVWLRSGKNTFVFNFNYVCSFLTILAVIGVYSFGLQSSAIVFVVLSSFILATCYSVKVAVYYLLAFFAYMAFIGLGLSFDIIEPQINASIYGTELSGWVVTIFSCIVASLLFLICASEYLKHLNTTMKSLEEQNRRVEYLANHDHLTGLTSPRLANEQLELTLNLAKRHGFKAAILYIDVDDFKIINDALGHDAGDFTLVQIADRLKDLIRDTDIACRQGGDEFLVILHYPVTREDCQHVCERLIAAFDSRIAYKEHELKVSLSIGVSIYPDDGDNHEELRQKADKAMYRSKQKHKNSFEFASLDNNSNKQ